MPTIQSRTPSRMNSRASRAPRCHDAPTPADVRRGGSTSSPRRLYMNALAASESTMSTTSVFEQCGNGGEREQVKPDIPAEERINGVDRRRRASPSVPSSRTLTRRPVTKATKIAPARKRRWDESREVHAQAAATIDEQRRQAGEARRGHAHVSIHEPECDCRAEHEERGRQAARSGRPARNALHETRASRWRSRRATGMTTKKTKMAARVPRTIFRNDGRGWPGGAPERLRRRIGHVPSTCHGAKPSTNRDRSYLAHAPFGDARVGQEAELQFREEPQGTGSEKEEGREAPAEAREFAKWLR